MNAARQAAQLVGKLVDLLCNVHRERRVTTSETRSDRGELLHRVVMNLAGDGGALLVLYCQQAAAEVITVRR